MLVLVTDRVFQKSDFRVSVISQKMGSRQVERGFSSFFATFWTYFDDIFQSSGRCLLTKSSNICKSLAKNEEIRSCSAFALNQGLNLFLQTRRLFKIRKKNTCSFSVRHDLFWPDLPKYLAKISQRLENRKNLWFLENGGFGLAWNSI